MKPNNKSILEELGDNLILRRASVDDTEALVQFNGEVHKDPDEDFAENIAAWVRDLMTKPHPTFKPEDFTIVEDTQTGKIVSCLNLINQTWAYEDIEFGVGRVELVGTHPDYRHRGLIRKQMEVVHQWSAERGHKVQAITGIAWYYRQFGYEMGLNLGGGQRGYPVHIPKLQDDEEEAYQFRQAEKKDLALITRLYKQGAQRSLISSVRGEDIWAYELSGRSKESGYWSEFRIIENLKGKPVGVLAHDRELRGTALRLHWYELTEGVSWLDVTPSVLRYLQTTGEAYAKEKEDKEFQGFYLGLGEEHPAYDVIPDRLPRVNPPYAWYVRVADIADFIEHISPVLEERIARSLIIGHTGELWLSFYTEGVNMAFDSGKLKSVERWEKPDTEEEAMAAFPDLTFLQLLFGYRSLDELRNSFADCYYQGKYRDAAVVLRVLFPKKASTVWGLG
jgi:GNAT superfamily N-acetyltransferase